MSHHRGHSAEASHYIELLEDKYLHFVKLLIFYKFSLDSFIGNSPIYKTMSDTKYELSAKI
jgi:hypothetical protein